MAYKTNSETLFNGILPDHKSLHELDEIENIINWKEIKKYYILCILTQEVRKHLIQE